VSKTWRRVSAWLPSVDQCGSIESGFGRQWRRHHQRERGDRSVQELA
jgi:hypothetical protein